MLQQQRHDLILRGLRDGPLSVVTLSDRLGVSQATIRRDLLILDGQGLLRRVHGGAALVPDADDPFADVAAVRAAEKEAVARRCAELIRDGETLLLDIGTTTHQVAKLLHGRSLTVITSSLAVQEELADDATVQLIMLGGVVRRDYRCLVGFLTEDNLRQVHADRLILSTSGIKPDGQIVDTTVVQVPIKRAMIAASDQVVLVADAAKFPGSGVARICGPDDLNVVVTNHDADPTTCAALREAGAEVLAV